MTSGLFRMDAGEALGAIKGFDAAWTPGMQQAKGITNEDRRAAAALLELASSKCREAAMKLRGKIMQSTIMVEAQDLDVGLRMVLTEPEERDEEVTGLVILRDRNEVLVTLESDSLTLGLNDAVRVIAE
jgi:hypothetical protein